MSTIWIILAVLFVLLMIVTAIANLPAWVPFVILAIILIWIIVNMTKK